MAKTAYYVEHGPFLVAKPTMRHRPALWECMLGTLYARNDAGETRYFDYNWDEAFAFAGIHEEGRDPRLYRLPREQRRTNDLDWPSVGKLVLWVLVEPKGE